MPNTHETLISLFSDIADAIREKTGNNEEIIADNFPEAINNIQGSLPSGTIDITQNEIVDVAQYEYANVNVPIPNDTTATVNDITIGKTAYIDGEKKVGVNDYIKPEKGIIFEDFDTNGSPHTVRVVGFTSDMPDAYLKNTFNANAQGVFVRNVQKVIFDESISSLTGQCLNVGTAITEVVVKGNIERILQNAISNLVNCQSITFLGNVHSDSYNAIMASFGGNNNVMLYDFSHCTSVPTVYTGASISQTFGHASGCVFRVPQALLTEWQNADMWKDLTDIVWQGV